MTTAARPRRTNRVPGHRISWFVYAGGYGAPLQKLARTANMRGHWPGWDAECSCGWKSNTGGATKRSVDNDVWGHMYDVADEAQRDALVGLTR